MKKKIIYILLLILLMIIIFLFSAQPGEESYQVSNSVLRYIAHLPVIGPFAQVYIRKMAHVTLYFFLGLGMNLVIYIIIKDRILTRHIVLNRIFGILLALFLCFLYACSDELHQIFVLGRTGKFSDVMVDMYGVLPGTILFLILLVAKCIVRNIYRVCRE